MRSAHRPFCPYLVCVLVTLVVLCANAASCKPPRPQTAGTDDQPPAVAAVDSGKAAYSNPIIDHIGPADPCVIRYEGKYYLYPTWDGRGYDVFVSDDLIHWQQKPKCFVDARRGAWAPDVFHNQRGDGRFYLYYTLDNPTGGKLIGVAVADNPLGPFRDQHTLATGAIDAHMFQDDDGAYYLYYVRIDDGFRILVQPMRDPLTPTGAPTKVLEPTESWERRRGSVTEGPWMLKHQGSLLLDVLR